MRTLAILALCGAFVIPFQIGAQAPAKAKAAAKGSASNYQVVASTKEVMLSMVIPSSDALFNAGEPKDDKDWEALRNQAFILAESGNLLLMPGRQVDAGDWAKAARLMTDAGKKALAAINKKDTDALTVDVGDAILTSCSSCHDKYMKK